MRKLLKLGMVYCAGSGTWSFYNNFLCRTPPNPMIHEQKHKKIVVVGAGIVGLSTAYYLSQHPENEVILIDKSERCAQECSTQNGCLVMRYNSVPWTYKPLMGVLRGIWRSDTSQAIYLTKAMQEPGMVKFFWYWLWQNRDVLSTNMMKLNDLQEILLDKLLVDANIDPKSINYEKDSVFYHLGKLQGIDLPKAFEKLAKALPPVPDGAIQDVIFGNQEMSERVFNKFPKFEGLKKYHYAVINPYYTLNTQIFCQKLDSFLKENRPNVKVLYQHELEYFIFDDAEKHLVRGVKVRGKKEVINCDAVVLCAGSFIARLLRENFRLICPVIPVKGYTMDIPTDLPNQKTHLGFRDIAFVATYLEPGYLRIAAFGDLSGQDKSFDPRRVRFLKNTLIERLDKKEVHQYKNLNTCLRPVPPDDAPLIGGLRFYPNVFLNAGHAGRGTTIGLATSKLLSEEIMQGKATSLPDTKPFSPSRFFL
ncbi:d-amino acid dehydrogenase small subunit [Stylonychia lemnae]|uniref:FAD-dependent oxidoreductase domain-containing protein 1 n=1 Tax=Stylonychia lemnae TaxID=5949 RepID=A0A078AD10_STYLE|nr:d-amino acid dehydrogenase small subunit [Stylonychia lemnae]|eukprot:CDW79422.1 d-amino acid dehydrogenase small subunit [Stylonychia lemnae]